MPQRRFAFLFTDIEGSTRLWESSPEAMSLSLRHHDRIVRDEIRAAGGSVFKTLGDAFCAVFPSASGAVCAAAAILRASLLPGWDARTGRLKIRMGVHVGEAEERDGDYFGPTLNRTARLMSAGFGDQILLSERCVAELPLAQRSVRDLGEHRLKDLSEPERIYQFVAGDLPAQFPAIRTLDVRRTNLPSAPNELLGRERELRVASDLVARHGLVTVVGPGGVGKTRFALELCAAASDAFPGGVWFVDLSGVGAGGLVASSVAHVLGLPERAGESLLTTIADFLSGKKVLILLDNCEHVIDDAARLVAAVTAAAPQTRFVATSRDVIAIAAERLMRLEPLDVPDEHAEPERQFASPSVQLFIERARAIHPELEIDRAALATIAEICRRLDGIPLAIELGAARLALLDVSEFARRMDDLLRLLAQKRRDVSPRQQTLEALVDWSYRLLGERDRIAFERLAVFTGRFDLADATHICGWGDLDAFDIEDAVESLVQKSFVVARAQERTARLRMYETIRQFAERRSSADPEAAETTALRHIAHFASLATAASDESSEDLASFEKNLTNIRTAFRRALQRPEQRRAAAALGLAIGRYSLETGAFAEGTAALVTARERSERDPAARAWIDFILAQIAWRQRRFDEARLRYEAVGAANVGALAGRAEWGLAVLARSTGRLAEAKASIDASIRALEGARPTFGLFQSYNELCGVELASGDAGAARAAAQRALEVAIALEHDRGRATALGNLATLAFYASDFHTAAALMDDALETSERSGARLSVAYFSCVRGEIALFCGDGAASKHALSALDLALEADWTALAARTAETLAAVSGGAGDTARAATLMSWADASRLALDIALDDDDRRVLERKRALAGWQPPALDEARASSLRMSASALLAFAKKEAT